MIQGEVNPQHIKHISYNGRTRTIIRYPLEGDQKFVCANICPYMQKNDPIFISPICTLFKKVLSKKGPHGCVQLQECEHHVDAFVTKTEEVQEANKLISNGIEDWTGFTLKGG